MWISVRAPAVGTQHSWLKVWVSNAPESLGSETFQLSDLIKKVYRMASGIARIRMEFFLVYFLAWCEDFVFLFSTDRLVSTLRQRTSKWATDSFECSTARAVILWDGSLWQAERWSEKCLRREQLVGRLMTKLSRFNSLNFQSDLQNLENNNPSGCFAKKTHAECYTCRCISVYFESSSLPLRQYWVTQLE